MQLHWQPYRLEFRHPFGLSSHTRKETHVVFLALTLDGVTGFGEACLPSYIGESAEQTIAFFGHAGDYLKRLTPDKLPLDAIRAVLALMPGNFAAKAAIDMALHDLWGKLENLSCASALHLEPAARTTSFTIAIDSEDKLEQKIHEASDYPVLKVKAGTRNDKQLIRSIRKFTRKPLYVDVNQGWKNRHFVLDMILWMKEQNVVLLEQPMPVSMKEDMQWVTDKSPLPVIADESVRNFDDLQRLDGSFSGVNIKLMKCGGLYEAQRMIDYLRRKNLKVMLGCMAESSCATAAMSQLMSLGDYIDLDAPNLYRNDPFEGLKYRHGRIFPTDGPGIGVWPRDRLFG
jgi:L-Ala-D/L-Glu epimerase